MFSGNTIIRTLTSSVWYSSSLSLCSPSSTNECTFFVIFVVSSFLFFSFFFFFFPKIISPSIDTFPTGSEGRVRYDLERMYIETRQKSGMSLPSGFSDKP